jgi:hypothetical protein
MTLPPGVDSVNWEEVFVNYEKGMSVDELSALHKINDTMILQRAEEYGWKKLARTKRPTVDLVAVKKERIERGRDKALNNCEKLEIIITEGLDTLIGSAAKAGDFKGQRAKVDIAYKLAELTRVVNDVRQRALGDTDDLAPLSSATNVINVLLPKVMAESRKELKLTSNEVIEAEVVREPEKLPVPDVEQTEALFEELNNDRGTGTTGEDSETSDD